MGRKNEYVTLTICSMYMYILNNIICNHFVFLYFIVSLTLCYSVSKVGVLSTPLLKVQILLIVKRIVSTVTHRCDKKALCVNTHVHVYTSWY